MPDEAAPADTRLIDLEIEKRRLECEKLRAEIAEVGQPLWKRAGYIASMSPILLAIVAFLSAWVTGYFDRQRQELGAEIEVLEGRRDELAARNAAIQEAIDEAYLRLKIVSGEAIYALSLIRGLDDGRDPAAELEALVQAVPDADGRLAAFAAEMRDRQSFADEILSIAEGELARMRDSLEVVPASEWARQLRYEIEPGQNLLKAPDGRAYDLERGRWLDGDGGSGQPGPPG